MVIPPEWFRLPESFLSPLDPVEGNPFPTEDPRHRIWSNATRQAEEEWLQIKSNAMSSPLTPSTFHEWVPSFLAARFDVWAKRRVHVVAWDADPREYETWLLSFAGSCLEELSYAESWLKEVAQACAPDPQLFIKSLLSTVRARLGVQVLFWTVQGRRARDLMLASLDARRAADNAVRETETAAKTAVGRNIDRHRIECGWTIEKLAEKVGVDRAAVSAHLKKGAMPRPATLKAYADAFSDELGRSITPQLLKE